MGIAVSLILIAFGAILTWAVNEEPSGLDLTVVGVILMIVGLVGLILTLLFWSQWAPYGRRARTRYFEDDVEVRRTRPSRREVVVEEDRDFVPGEPPPP